MSFFSSILSIGSRLKLLFDIALEEKCTKLITGDNCTKLAAQILSDMAQGKGAHVALECVRHPIHWNSFTDLIDLNRI